MPEADLTNALSADGAGVLLEPGADEDLARNGFTIVPVLDRSQCEALRIAYEDRAPAGDHGLTVDYMRPDRRTVRDLAALLRAVWDEHLPEITRDQRVVMTTFVVKHPGVESEMFLHDDRSYVDERIHRAYTLWMPLVDVGPGIPNGGLQIVPGSHLLSTGWSGSNTPDVIRPWEPVLRRALVDVTVPAGSAVVYDTRLLHASRANLTDRPRVAAVCALAPVDVPLLHVVATGRRHRLIHRVDEEFFLDHHPREIERKMPGRCPVVEEVDEEPALDRASLALAVGPSAVGAPVVPVPADLRSAAPSTELPQLPLRSVSRLERSTDLVIEQLTPSEPVAGIPATLVGGPGHGYWTVALERRTRPTSAPGPTGWQRIAGPRRDSSDLVVVEMGGRVSLVAPDLAGRSVDLVVLESPTVGAGVVSAVGAAALDLGVSVRLPVGEPITVWNDGPGQLVVVVVRRKRSGRLPRLPWRRRRAGGPRPRSSRG